MIQSSNLLLCVSVYLAAPGLCLTQEPSASAAQVGGMRELVEECWADRGALRRFYTVPGSSLRCARLAQFATDWLAKLERLEFAGLAREGQIDYLLLQARLRDELADIALERARALELALIVPYAARIAALAEARQRVDPEDPAQAAAELTELKHLVADAQAAIQEKQAPPAVSAALALRAARRVPELREALAHWYEFRAGYDPLFTWWVSVPYASLRDALLEHERLLREELAGIKPGDRDTIIGDPIGRALLEHDLAAAWIPYSPEELIEIGQREFAWCVAELRLAAQALGLGEDWQQALELVKQRYVPPGAQPALVLELAHEAWDYVEQHNLVSVPSLAKEVWRMQMLSPESQRTSPFFLGGESIQVSYPTDSMTQPEKMMSMRGNNRHFSRATVQHEVIPGHHLQQYMTERYFPYRRPFASPFWTEGWALWWEMLLWERGFFATPEDKIGALFWRLHRCARIQFSLRFHLGEWTAEQCVAFLVEQVGHEAENAEAEVRRSFESDYGPLYQLAYMIGALQFRALHEELVVSGTMSERDFHDAVLKGGNMPVAMVRARLNGTTFTRDYQPQWRFDTRPR